MKENSKNLPTRGPSTVEKEAGLTSFVDPTVLVKDNPTAWIISDEIYNRIKNDFTPNLLDPVQIVQVMTRTTTDSVVVRPLAVDGIHRARVCSDNKGMPLPSGKGHYPEKIAYRDATSEYLKMPWVVQKDERYESLKALTMTQYLRVIIPWTKEHAQIAPDRIAAHLINGWDNMVGSPLSSKFSALAALNFLRNSDVPKENTGALKEYLSEQKELLKGTSSTERNLIEYALVETNRLIQQAKLKSRDVAEAAFTLLGRNPNSIGGEVEARREVSGLLNSLLHNPKTEEALKTYAKGDIATLEERRVQLGELLFKAISKKNPTAVETLLDAITDSSLSISAIASVLEARQPLKTYRETKRRSSTDRVIQAYKAVVGRDDLTEIESELVKRLAAYYDPNLLEQYGEIIRDATETISGARLITVYVSEQIDKPTQTGKNKKEWEDILSELSEYESDILNWGPVDDIKEKTLELKKYTDKIRQDIQRLNAKSLSKEVNTKSPKTVVKVQVEKKIPTDRPVKTSYIVSKTRREVKEYSINETLIEILSGINFQLETGKFKAEDLSPDTLVWVEKIINQLGKLRFNTTNIVGIINRHLETKGDE